ncbi:response regulator transcription factor [Niallia sp. 01092]|uniref:response regulator transcription factor n=1 Tax=unclassified Niallia TaxID=2837522 RepID=UPI003FD5C0EF
MYRVVIVDDEPISRNGIEAFIDWKREGMLVESLCANGEEALKVLKASSADILITDIKMPIMNGIELMKQALEHYPNLKVVMLSSYSDFEYVKEGLKLGAVDYLLKSALDPVELLDVLRRCISILEEERRKEIEFHYYQQGAAYKERKYMEQAIKRIMVQEQCSSSSMDWEPKWLKQDYVCMYITLDRAEVLMEKHGYLHVQLLLEEFQEMFYQKMDDGAAVLSGERSLFLLFPKRLQNWRRKLYRLKRSVETELGITISAGYAMEQGRYGILKGLANSRMACQRRFFEGVGGIYGWTENQAVAFSSKMETEHADWQSFFEIIRNGDPVSSAVEYAINHWKNLCNNPEQIKKEACDLLIQISELQADAKPLPPDQFDLLENAETLDEIASLFKRILEEMETSFILRSPDNGNGGQLITKALAYMDSHYTENLTLQNVADKVHVSKNYFSILFKQQTGYNFIDYLIELRIREAKRLLTEEDGRIYDVAESLGFNGVNYFSRLFKKMTGLTPLEYRKKYKETCSTIT